MEPVWMTLGQIAGLTATEALRLRTGVAHIDPDPLPKKLGSQPGPYA